MTTQQKIYYSITIGFSISFSATLLLIGEYKFAVVAAIFAIGFITDTIRAVRKINRSTPFAKRSVYIPFFVDSEVTVLDRVIRLEEISKFKVGQIYKMNPASRSQVKQPYYVEIIEVGEDYIITNIPERHSLKISYGNNWDYHYPRFEYVGMKDVMGYLLWNQPNILPE